METFFYLAEEKGGEEKGRREGEERRGDAPAGKRGRSVGRSRCPGFQSFLNRIGVRGRRSEEGEALNIYQQPSPLPILSLCLHPPR